MKNSVKSIFRQNQVQLMKYSSFSKDSLLTSFLHDDHGSGLIIIKLQDLILPMRTIFKKIVFLLAELEEFTNSKFQECD